LLARCSCDLLSVLFFFSNYNLFFLFAEHDDTARTAELDDDAALLDPARCDDAELEWCSEVPALE